MNLTQRQIIFWFAGSFALGALFYLLGGVLAPFLAGLALAYILDPLVDLLERFHIPRFIAAFLALLFSLSFFVGLFLLLVPVLLSQFSTALGNLPSYIDQLHLLLAKLSPNLKEWLGDTTTALKQTEKFIPEDLIRNLFDSLLSGGKVFVSTISFLVITPIVTLYMLRDWDKIIGFLSGLLPKKKSANIRAVVREIDQALAASLRGLFTVCVILAIFYGTALHLLGLDFGLLIGIFSGLISFIPYAGAIFGFVFALQIALFQFWPDWQWALLLCGGVFGLGQILEGYVLTPKLVGDKIGVPVVWIIFALMAFSALGGFAGLLIALPLSAVIAVLLRHAIKFYKASDYYKK